MLGNVVDGVGGASSLSDEKKLGKNPHDVKVMALLPMFSTAGGEKELRKK